MLVIKRNWIDVCACVRISGLALVMQIAGACAAMADGAPGTVDFSVADGPKMENFNLLAGQWNVESHSLKQRMATEQVWLENHMETEYRILLGGLVAVNDTYGKFNGRDMHGIMIRTYEPELDEWLIQWMSRDYPHLTEQVRGRFENGVGVFYGSEVNAQRVFKMRFRWKMITPDHAHWDQSYQDPETLEWEINWTLDLHRKAADEKKCPAEDSI